LHCSPIQTVSIGRARHCPSPPLRRYHPDCCSSASYETPGSARIYLVDWFSLAACQSPPSCVRRGCLPCGKKKNRLFWQEVQSPEIKMFLRRTPAASSWWRATAARSNLKVASGPGSCPGGNRERKLGDGGSDAATARTGADHAPLYAARTRSATDVASTGAHATLPAATENQGAGDFTDGFAKVANVVPTLKNALLKISHLLAADPLNCESWVRVCQTITVPFRTQYIPSPLPSPRQRGEGRGEGCRSEEQLFLNGPLDQEGMKL